MTITSNKRVKKVLLKADAGTYEIASRKSLLPPAPSSSTTIMEIDSQKITLPVAQTSPVGTQLKINDTTFQVVQTGKESFEWVEIIEDKANSPKQHMKTYYCEKCGEKMDTLTYTDHFDRNTGEKVEYIKYTCPKITEESKNSSNPILFITTGGTYMGHLIITEKK